MILEYSVTNTFSIRDTQTISFEAVKSDGTDEIHVKEIDGKKLLKFACFYGANASGKTNMVESLSFYLDFMLASFTGLNPGESTHFDPFRFDDKTADEPGKFNLVFYAPDYNQAERLVKYTYDISLNSRKVLYEALHYSPKGQSKLVFERCDGKGIKWGSDVSGPKKIISDLARPNCSVIGAGAQANHIIFKMLYSYFTQKIKVIGNGSSLNSPGALKQIEDDQVLRNRVLGLLQAADFGSITDIEIESMDVPVEYLNGFPEMVREDFQRKNEKPKTRNAFLVHSYGDKVYRLPLYKESSGTQHVFELAKILSYAADSCDVIVDEIDSSLHPDIVETVLRLFLELSDDSQLIFTTHNQDLLDSGILRDDEVWFCYKTDEGNSIYNCITDFTGIRKEPSRKKLYKAGKFGSLPIIDIPMLRELFSAEKNE